MQENHNPTLMSLAAQVARIDERLSSHVHQEENETREIFRILSEIRETLAQAKGGQKVFIWLVGVLMGGAALASSWIKIKP